MGAENYCAGNSHKRRTKRYATPENGNAFFGEKRDKKDRQKFGGTFRVKSLFAGTSARRF